jgi:hypothetical protein
VSLVSARERLVTMPNDEKPGGSATEDVIVVEGSCTRYGVTEAVAGTNLKSRPALRELPISSEESCHLPGRQSPDQD